MRKALNKSERCPSWPKGHDWKSCVPTKSGPRVRIPLSPPCITEGGEAFSNRGMRTLSVLGLALMIGLEVESAQEQLTYVGRVITLYGSTLSIEADNGNIMYFVVGRRTVYIPTRVPAIGERVEVEYYFRRGQNVAVQVRVVPLRTKT